MPRAFHTAPASLTRTCAPRGRPQPGQPRSFVPRRRSLLFLTESQLGCSTALTYLRRGGRRRGAPRYSRFFGPAVTRHGPRIGGSAAALSTGSAQNFFVSPSDSRRPNRWQRPPLVRFVRRSRLSFVPHSLQPATRTVTSRTSKGSGDSDRPQPTVTRQPADPQVVIRLHLHGRSRRSSVLSGWLLIHCSHPRNPRTKLRRPSRWRALSSLGLNQGMTRPSAWIPL
jgi:hypothetical protein